MTSQGIERVVSTLTSTSKTEALLKDVKQFGGGSEGTMGRLSQFLECKDYGEQNNLGLYLREAGRNVLGKSQISFRAIRFREFSKKRL